MSSLWDAPHGFTTGPTGHPMQLLVCTTCYAVVEKAYAEQHKNFCDSARIVLEYAARTP